MRNNPNQFPLDKFSEFTELLLSRLDTLEELLTQKEVAKIEKPITRLDLCKHLGISLPTARNMEKKGLITRLKTGSRVVRYDLNKCLTSIESKK